jgi:hypothetical protein
MLCGCFQNCWSLLVMTFETCSTGEQYYLKCKWCKYHMFSLYDIQRWRWKQYASLKQLCLTASPHGNTTKKYIVIIIVVVVIVVVIIIIIIITAMRTSNLTRWPLVIITIVDFEQVKTALSDNYVGTLLTGYCYDDDIVQSVPCTESIFWSTVHPPLSSNHSLLIHQSFLVNISRDN